VTDPLQNARYLSFATFRRNGAAVPTPVWFAERGGRYYLYSAGDAGKVKRLRNSDRARVAACNIRGKLLGPWLEARARIIIDATTIAAAARAIHTKYGIQSRLGDALSTLAGRIQRRAWIEIELAAGGAAGPGGAAGNGPGGPDRERASTA
jgi:PPOX class probable F420-dependent enzyme